MFLKLILVSINFKIAECPLKWIFVSVFRPQIMMRYRVIQRGIIGTWYTKKGRSAWLEFNLFRD